MPNISKHCHRFKRHYLQSEHVFPDALDFSDVIVWEKTCREFFIFFFAAAVKKHRRAMLMQGSNGVRRKPAPEKITETAWRCTSCCLSCTKCWDLFIYDRVSPPHYLKLKSNSMCLQRNVPHFMQQTYKNRDSVFKNTLKLHHTSCLFQDLIRINPELSGCLILNVWTRSLMWLNDL